MSKKVRTRKQNIQKGIESEKYKAPVETPSEQANDIERKVNALNYYNSLSDSDKLSFQNEIKKKKLRDNYASYVAYTFGGTYIQSAFHKILCSICQNVVERIEKGEQVRVLLSTPPQVGKGYPVDFPVLTTKGWKKHGDLVVGDYVYNDKGEQVKVIGTQKPYMWHCCELTFANGEKHIITREHLWKVFLEHENRINGIHHNIRKEHIIETQDLMFRLPKQRRSPYVLINAPLQNDEKELPIDPYVFGLWLGDGLSKNNEIVVSNEDLHDELVGIGDKETYSIVCKKGNPNVSYIKLGTAKDTISKNSHFSKGNHKWDFTQKLSDLGVHKNKHIPVQYLLASENQRWELLRGLMDTDGTIDKYGKTCEYCGINKELCENVWTLLRSLGIKAYINEYDAKLYGKFVSKKYRIMFAPNKGQQIFKIARKQKRVDNKIPKDREDKFKYFITSIVPCEDMLVSCIQVEGGMYLAGKGLIPTHNSTHLTETLPSWFIGRNPDLSCIITAYNSDIAEKFGDRNRQKVKQFGKEIFGIEISDSQDNKTLFQIKNHQGQIFSAGILGGLTSNPSALTIVDDPFKNGEEAESQDIRDRVERVYWDSIETRTRALGGGIIVVHTRWHEDDLIGRLAKKQGFIVINIPLVWESGYDKLLHRKVGETLCPELGRTTEWCMKTKANVGSRVWNALYQGRPYVEGGNIIQRKDIRRYDKYSLPNQFDEMVISCDLSFGATSKSSDPNCYILWGRKGGNHYLLEWWNKKCGFQETLNAIKMIRVKYQNARKILIESKANGRATIELLNQSIGGVVPFDPQMNSKESRLKLSAPYFESGSIYVPTEEYNPNVEEIIEQWLKFPNVAHDEYVDTTTQYLLDYSYKNDCSKIGTDKRYADISMAIRNYRLRF